MDWKELYDKMFWELERTCKEQGEEYVVGSAVEETKMERKGGGGEHCPGIMFLGVSENGKKKEMEIEVEIKASQGKDAADVEIWRRRSEACETAWNRLCKILDKHGLFSFFGQMEEEESWIDDVPEGPFVLAEKTTLLFSGIGTDNVLMRVNFGVHIKDFSFVFYPGHMEIVGRWGQGFYGEGPLRCYNIPYEDLMEMASPYGKTPYPLSVREIIQMTSVPERILFGIGNICLKGAEREDDSVMKMRTRILDAFFV